MAVTIAHISSITLLSSAEFVLIKMRRKKMLTTNLFERDGGGGGGGGFPFSQGQAHMRLDV